MGACRYEFQLTLGRKLAAKIVERGWEIDCIVPVPDGSRPAAIELSAALKLPYREGLVKNRYVGRTFIMPDQRTRELSVKRKLNAMPAVFSGKKVLLVDDSIVRGTTMSQIVDMVRKAGAAKVYLASASPAVKFPNVYGAPQPPPCRLTGPRLADGAAVARCLNLCIPRCGGGRRHCGTRWSSGGGRGACVQVWTFQAGGSLWRTT